MLAEADAKEGVLPFDVEVHQTLDVDENRMPAPVDQHVIRSEFPVDESVLRAWLHSGGQLACGVLQTVAGGRQSSVTRCSFGKVVKCAIEDDLFA